MALFQSSRNAPPRFGCFGKLPTYADFMSLNVEGVETQALAAWLQEGIGAAPRAAAVDPEQFVHYVWRPEGGRRVLVGVLWQSADQAGRRFPFTIFTSVPQQQIVGHGVRSFLAAAALRARIHEIHQSLARSPRIRDQYVLINDSPVPAVPEQSDVWRAWSERSEAQALRREDAGTVAGHVVALARFAERALAAPELPDFALRIQLLGPDADVEIASWTQLLCDRLGAPDIDASYFLRFSRTGPTAFLFHRELVPADLAYVLAPSDDYRGGESIAVQGNGAAPARTRLADAFQRMWAQRPPSYRSILDLVANAPSAEMAAPAAVAPATPSQFTPATPSQFTPATPSQFTPATPSHAEREQITGPIVLGTPTPGASAPAAAAEPPPPVPQDAAGPAPVAGSQPPVPAERPESAADADSTDEPAARPADAAETGEVSEADLATRIEALAAGTLLPGRLVRAAPAVNASAMETAETEHDGGRSVLLYLEDSGYAALLGSLEPPDVERIEQQIAACAEARALLTELARRQREVQERLARTIDASCARAQRPGKAS